MTKKIEYKNCNCVIEIYKASKNDTNDDSELALGFYDPDRRIWHIFHDDTSYSRFKKVIDLKSSENDDKWKLIGSKKYKVNDLFYINSLEEFGSLEEALDDKIFREKAFKNNKSNKHSKHCFYCGKKEDIEHRNMYKLDLCEWCYERVEYQRINQFKSQAIEDQINNLRERVEQLESDVRYLETKPDNY